MTAATAKKDSDKPPQIIYDTRAEIEKLLDDRDGYLSLLQAKLKALEWSTFKLIIAAGFGLALPVWTISNIQDSQWLRRFNFGASFLGACAAGFAVKNCRKFQEMDRRVYAEQRSLGRLKNSLNDAEEYGFDLFLQDRISQLMPKPPQTVVQQGGGRKFVEWAPEAHVIQQIFKKYDAPVTVNEKEMMGAKIFYTVSPTNGVDPEKIISVGKTDKFQTSMLIAGYEDATVFAVVGRLILQVKNPFYQPQPVQMPVNPQQREAEHVGHSEQQSQQQYQPPMQQDLGQQFTPPVQSVQPVQQYTPPSYTPEDYFAGRVAGYQWMQQLVNYPAVLIYGSQGSGKTTFVNALARGKIVAGHEMQVLDPHRIYGHWQGLECIGSGMDYVAIDAAMESFIESIKADYKMLAIQEGYRPSAKTIIAEELTNYASRCNNAGEFFMTSLSDIRKCNKCVLYISHGRTLTTLGGAKGAAKTRDSGLLELELLSKISPTTGQPMPAGKGRLKLPGRDPVDVEIPNFKDVPHDFTDLVRANDDPYEEFDESFEDKHGVDPDEILDDEPKPTQPQSGQPRPKTIPSRDELVAMLLVWIKQLGRTPSDAEISAKLEQILGMKTSNDVLTAIKWLLGGHGINFDSGT